MRYFTAAVVGAVMSAGAAQAAVYHYDVTMELTELDLVHATFNGEGDIPDLLNEARCSVGSSYYECTTSLDLLGDNIAEIEFFGHSEYHLFESVLSASLLLDSKYDQRGSYPPYCNGSAFLCSGINQSTETWGVYSATSEGFRVRTGAAPWDMKYVSSEGIEYISDSYQAGSIPGASFHGAWFQVSYETTNLSITEIAPIPLPASLPLLGIGIAAVGFASRRRRS